MRQTLDKPQPHKANDGQREAADHPSQRQIPFPRNSGGDLVASSHNTAGHAGHCDHIGAEGQPQGRHDDCAESPHDTKTSHRPFEISTTSR